MRTLIALLVVASAGCAQLLGIDSPAAGDDDAQFDGGPGAPDAAGNVADAAPGPDAPPPLFDPGGYTPTGMNTRGVVIADVNEDGDRDVLVVNRGSNDVSILLGLGDGTFMAKLDVPMGVQPEALAVADIDGDTNLDLLVASFGDSNLVVRRANPAMPGVFEAPAAYPAGTVPRGIAVGHVTGDSKPDVVLCAESQTVVLEQLAGGAFTSVQTLSPGQMSPRCGVGIGALDGNVLPDLLFTAGNAFLARQDFATPGTFLTPTMFATTGMYNVVVVADLNGDVLDDVVLGGDISTGGVIVLQDTGTPGQFLAPQLLQGQGYAGAAVGLFGGGSMLDIAYVDESNDRLVIYVDGAGTTYVEAQLLPTQGGPRGVAVGDLTGDGKADVAVADNLAGGVSIYIHK